MTLMRLLITVQDSHIITGNMILSGSAVLSQITHVTDGRTTRITTAYITFCNVPHSKNRNSTDK